MSYEENIRAILESNFSQTKDELIDNAVKSILAIKQGRSYIKIPDNATNGDMTKAVFPNIDASVSGEGDVIDVYELGIYCQTFDLDWWKAPYERS